MKIASASKPKPGAFEARIHSLVHTVADKALLALRMQKHLMSLAKAELIDKEHKAKDGRFEFNKDILAGISKQLAEKHKVPDAVADKAVMGAVASLQESADKQRLAQQQAATTGLKAAASKTPEPPIPTYASISDGADNRATDSKRIGPGGSNRPA